LSVTVDTNILIYAANERDPANSSARDLLAGLMEGPELFYLFWPSIMGFLRISTNRVLFPHPYSPEQALNVIAGMIDRPHVRTPSEQPGFLDLYRLVAPSDTRGKLVPDAHLATLMCQHGVNLIYSRDRDFRRFDGIRVVDPFA
jgi:toxin-antitoxin system PIN domain toxin